MHSVIVAIKAQDFVQSPFLLKVVVRGLQIIFKNFDGPVAAGQMKERYYSKDKRENA